MTRAAFVVRGVRHSFGDGRELRIDGIAVPEGGMVAIIGGSGSGKSTLLNLLGGLLPPEAAGDARFVGIVRRHDRDECFDMLRGKAEGLRWNLGFIFQAGHLLRNGTVDANIAASAASAASAVPAEFLSGLYVSLKLLPDHASGRARSRSGGEIQRIAVIRALARGPSIVLADEPTASLDPSLADTVMDALRAWKDDKLGFRTVVWVTHDLDQVRRYADHVIVLADGERTGKGLWPIANPGDTAILRAFADRTAEPMPTPDDPPSNLPALGSPVPPPPRTIFARATTGWPARVARVRAVGSLAISEVFSGKAVEDPALRQIPLRRLVAGFGKWLDLFFQLGLFALIAASFLAGPVLDRMIAAFLSSSNLSHVVIQGSAGSLTYGVVDEIDRALRDPATGVPALPGAADPAAPRVFGRWHSTAKPSVAPFGADAECRDAEGRQSGHADGFLAVHQDEPMLTALKFFAPAREGEGWTAGAQPPPLMTTDRSSDRRAFVTRNFLASRLGLDAPTAAPASFCVKLRDDWWRLDIAGVVAELPSDNGNLYDFVIGHGIYGKAFAGRYATGVAESFQKAAVYFDMAKINNFNAFARGFVPRDQDSAGFRIAVDESSDKVRAAVDLLEFAKHALSVAKWAFLAMAAAMAAHAICGHLRAQRKAVVVLRIFGLTRRDLTAYFVLQSAMVQVAALFVFLLVGAASLWVLSLHIPSLGPALDVGWGNIVSFVLLVLLAPLAVCWLCVAVALRRLDGKPAATILKQSE